MTPLLAGLLVTLAAAPTDFGSRYMAFLDAAKTPRLLVRQVAREAAARGFRSADVFGLRATTAKPGDRLMFVSRERTIALVVVGREPVTRGFRLIGTHVDTPKFRVVQRPVVVTDGRVALRTVFHGGVKEYQWLTRPLALVGTVNRADGSKEVDVELGLKDDATFAMATWTSAPVPGGAGRKDPWAGWAREYDVVVAGFPKGRGPPGPQSVDPKAAFLKLLDARFGITEADLDSSELYFVPVQTARWVGVGERLVGGFGQDDKVCSYAAARAAIDLDVVPEKTAIAFLSDREEIGSTGPSGAASEWIDALVAHLIVATRHGASAARVTEVEVRAAFANAEVLSSDVTAGVNPLFSRVHELKNAARLGRGPAMMKWTGRNGKLGGSDAHAEFVHRVSRIFAAAKVPLQIGNIGRVDEGGGGTIAKFLANKGANVLDLGVPMISMHAAFDVTHVGDIENLVRGARSFFVAE
jgi:aspartyl aminopeptidase